jgi:soluble lytic murein transglycosylase
MVPAGRRRAAFRRGAEWKVRAALRVQDWGSVRASIEKMPPALAAQPAWVYWLGRAYRAGGRLEDANTLFAKIAGQPDFYGTLANDELGRSTMTPPKASPPSREELAQVSAIPGVQRAQAFFRLNLRSEGSQGMELGLRSMSDRELLAASEIAVRAGNYDRAIAAADRTRTEHDYSLRYLAPYGDQVRPAARNQALDDAWVYGLMRQESRFISSARSNVGASGLMQLMPATAKWVANKIGLKDFQQAGSTIPKPTCCSAPPTCAWSSKASTTTRCWPRLPTTPARVGRADGVPIGRWKAPSTPKPFPSTKPATT